MAIELRDYQEEAVKNICSSWYDVDRVLLSMATGTGKTRVGAYIVNAWQNGLASDHKRPDRILWLAHRDELILQAAEAIEAATGEPVAIEKGDQRAGGSAELFERPVVVSSIQTLQREERRSAFGQAEFGLVVHDESQHIVAESHSDVINYFSPAKLLGMTATADRNDEISLGQIFQKVAFHYDILSGIRDGWLCRVLQRFITVEGLDFLNPKGGVADYTNEELEAIISQETPLHTMITGVIQDAGDRPTIMFTPGVASAEGAALLLNDRYGKTARWVSGKTDENERRKIADDFRDGKFQYLCNCDVYSEGADFPTAACIAICRPTKSRMKYAQWVGRGLRGGPRCPVPGKTDCLVIDLVGAGQKHKLTTTVDLLGGKYDEAVVEAIRAATFNRGSDASGMPADVLEEISKQVANADEIMRAKRREIIATAKLKQKTVDPFAVLADSLGVGQVEEVPEWWKDWPASDYQVRKLEKAGIKADGALTMSEAQTLLSELKKRQNEGLCSYKQARFLRGRGLNPGMTFEQAGAVMMHFNTRPGGYGFTPEDHKMRAIAKRKGRYLDYGDLFWAPTYMVRNGAECITYDGKRFKTDREVYAKDAGRDDRDRVRINVAGAFASVAPWDVLNLKKNKWCGERPREPEAEEAAF
jgi:superfamily II DNA or RNA helicase